MGDAVDAEVWRERSAWGEGWHWQIYHRDELKVAGRARTRLGLAVAVRWWTWRIRRAVLSSE